MGEVNNLRSIKKINVSQICFCETLHFKIFQISGERVKKNVYFIDCLDYLLYIALYSYLDFRGFQRGLHVKFHDLNFGNFTYAKSKKI